jgi:hypothetical protein
VTSSASTAPPARPARRVPTASLVALWGARLLWLVVAVFGGPAIGGALHDHDRAVQVIGTVGAWAGFAVGAAALALLSTVSLTVVRAVVPGALVVGVAALIGGADPGDGIALIAPAIAATGLVASAEVGRAYLQASAYGDELRFGLRPPIGYLFACAVTWLVAASAAVAAPLAWAARAWVVAVVASAVVLAAALLLPRRWHQLSRRWLVLVPAGLVVHDPVVLADTLLLRRPTIESIGLDDRGIAAQRAADLTGPTPGLAVEVRLHPDAATTAVLAPRPDTPNGTVIHLTALVVSPTRPGSVVTAAAARHLPVA